MVLALVSGWMAYRLFLRREARAVIRLSGPSAEATGRSVVHCPGRQEWGSHRVVYGHVIDGEGRRLDEVLLLLMRGPRSFTGEDVVEIHCHGGVIAVQRVLEQVLRQPGVRRAQPGEFSQRAVLNGRLDLTRAEAVSELVAARSRRAAELAMAGLDGGIQAQITGLRERLLDQLTHRLGAGEIEPAIEYGPLTELARLGPAHSRLPQHLFEHPLHGDHPAMAVDLHHVLTGEAAGPAHQ